jgi:LysM repeat protein
LKESNWEMSWNSLIKLPHSVLVAFALILLLVLPLGAQAQGDGPLYVVQAGDALSRIAFNFGTSVEAIVAENGILNPNLLVPGTTLVIPGFHDLSGYITTGGQIQYGASAESLSLLHGLSQESLARYNRWLNPERAYVGQPLILPQEIDSGAAVPTSRSILPASGESLLEIAIRENINPWSAARTDQHVDRLWIIPGNPLRLSSPDQETNALPDPITGAQVNPQVMVQGKTVRIYLDYAGSAIVDGQLGEWSLSFHELDPARLVALQGVSAVAEPGTYDLEIRLREGTDDPAYYAFRQPVPLISGGYGFDPVLDVPGVTLDPATIAAEQQIWDLITGEATPERMWEGAFS